MIAWRLCRRAHARLDGEGARLYGGRWNRRGTPVVYLASSLSLAAFEYFVHVAQDLVPGDLVSIRVTIPDDAPREMIDRGALPRSWRRYPGPEALEDMGDDWAARAESLVLVVPSVVVPEETNLLLNPTHPRMRDVSAGRPQAFSFDPRMWK